MAHELDFSTGRAACFTAGEAPWHRLGINVTAAQTSADAIRLAALDWTVRKEPVFYQSAVGPVAVPNQYAVVRSDTGAALGTVGSWYEPFQNQSAFDFMDALVDDRLAMYETAGALKSGRRVWMMARIPAELCAAGNDVIHPYVLLTNSHDGSGSLRMIPTSVRVVCQNTLNLALGRAGSADGVTITHTESLSRRVADARQKLGIVIDRVEQFGEQVKTLARKSLTKDQLAAYFAGLVEARAEKPQKKLLEAFAENFENPRNALPEIRGSVWAAFNAVSEYADHQMTVFGQESGTRLDNRLNSVWFGAAHAFKQRAFAAAVALAA
jgi:phage/plasmid-like protein (TIGR03299 family)